MTAKTAMQFYGKYQEKQQISLGKRKFDCKFQIFCLKKPKKVDFEHEKLSLQIAGLRPLAIIYEKGPKLWSPFNPGPITIYLSTFEKYM